MLRFMLSLFFLILPSFIVQASFELEELANDATAYFTSLRVNVPPQSTSIQRETAFKQARAALAQKDAAKAITACESAVALGVNNTMIWLTLSEAWTTAPKLNRERALHAGYLAYRVATKPEDRVAALWRLVEVLAELFNRPDQALQAALEIRAIIADNRTAASVVSGLEPRIEALRQRVGLTLKSVEVLSDEALPKVCLHFSDPLNQRKEIRFADFIRLQPVVQNAPEVRDETLCLTGLDHGTTYRVTVRQGLPGENGLTVKKDEIQSFRVPDRNPLVAFRGTGFILPRVGSEGVPVTTVNLDRVTVKVYRINDRNLVGAIRDGDNERRFTEQLSEYRAEEIADNHGELVWEGEMAVKNERNHEITTALSFHEVVADPNPGLYVVTAEPLDVSKDFHAYEKATQWLLVSDIGLSVFRGADGITAFARAFSTAKPLAGVEIALVARNNAELARATSDALGRARFPVGLTRGTGGKAPIAVMAYQGADFAMLDLTSAAFDLSDRGVGGRAAPGPMDAYLYTDRGVYRQGETVHLSVLLRDAKTVAVDNFPLTVKVLRPSGTEYYSGVLPVGPAGGFFLPLTLSKTAPLGAWQVQVFSDPKGQPVGQVGFQVDDFVPERLSLELTPATPWLESGKPFDLLVKGRFLYGPPAAGLNGTAELSLQVDPQPYPQYKGYRFGLAQETVTQKLEQLEFPITDAEGGSRVAAKLPPLPDTTQPLRAEFRVTLSEPGGRPARQSLTVPVRTQSYAIGIRPRFEGGAIPEGQDANFEIIAVAPDGAPLAKPDLAWELVEERTTYQWYFKEGRYNYQGVTRAIPRRSGKLTLSSLDKPATVALNGLEFGRYRLEVVDKATRVASSLRFSSGWQMNDAASDTPDKLEITADKPAYAMGETARVRLTPPFAGEVLLTVATDRLFDARVLSVPNSGATVEIPIDPAWGPGAYVTATVFRPPVKGRERQPVRAIGLTWLTIDPASRTLAVALTAPEVTRPRQALTVDLKVMPATGTAEEAWITLAAVDEGILQLTDFVSPDPGRHLFGKRMLGLDIRDDYGRLIDVLDGPFGALRQGGDASGAGLPVVPFTVVSLFHGPVKISATGSARVTLDIPDFNGQLRLMAVAWGQARVGSASARLIVRDPLVASATLPRFLAPGDDSRVTVSLHNVEAPAGRYTARLRGSNAVASENSELNFELTTGERRDAVVPIKGLGVGIGKIELSVMGPEGLAIEHSHKITVRPARPVETQFLSQPMPSGDTLRLSAAQLAGYVPGTGRIAATFSSGPPFDVAGIAQALDRYPHGCLEQTISRALPLLVVRDVETALGVKRKPDATLEGRIQQAITRVLDKQRYDGSFATWGSSGETHPWLTAYAVEFLTRARGKGHPVPEKPLQDALGWLRNHAVDGGREPGELTSRAYALHALALAGELSGGPARYFHDTYLDKLPTPLSKGQLGAALARLGDRERAQNAFAAATANLARDYWQMDYGSTTRDAAALAALMSEVDLLGDQLRKLLDRLPAASVTANATNTQEQAWLMLAANELMHGNAPLELTWSGGTRLKGDPVTLTPTPKQLAAEGVSITNVGKSNAWQALSLAGVPMEPRPAAREGLRIKRNFLDRQGQPINLDHVRQNDVFVVLLEGEASTKLDHQIVITHPLPAGWEIEKIGIAGGEGSDFPWLTDLTTTATVEGRDDRYVAAVDLSPSAQAFKLAYLVRAVTIGNYELPGAQVEDMYRPRFFARQATGRIVVYPVE
ncbi:alpha-2-macroglobulin [Gammaproteobacteria bacterium]